MLATPFPNQPPPFEGRNLATGDPLLRAALAAHGVPIDASLAAWGATLGSADVAALADAANRQPPRLAHARRDRRAHRRGRVRSGVARADAARDARRRALRAVVGAGPGRAARARRALLPARAGRERHAVPADDDVRRDPGADARMRRRRASRRRGCTRVLAADYDPRPLPVAAKRARADRHGHDRAAGRLGRAREPHDRDAHAGDALRRARPQVVLLGAAVRRAPRARAGRRRARRAC